MDLPWSIQGRLSHEPYVLPSQCEQVFYSEVPGRQGWSFFIRHDPRGRTIKYNIVEEAEDGVEEEGDHAVEDQHELDVDDHNVTQEDVEELVEADDVRDNVHDEDVLTIITLLKLTTMTMMI